MIKLVLRQLLRLSVRLILAALVIWACGLGLYLLRIMTLSPYGGRAEGIVVLTGGEARVAAGVNLLAEGRADRLLISGVNERVKIADIMALADRKPDKALSDRIDLGFAAQNTLGNADEAANWVTKNGLQSLIIVTSHYHMPRALVHLGAQLPDVALYSYPVRAPKFDEAEGLGNVSAWRTLVGDYNKLLLTYPQILMNRLS